MQESVRYLLIFNGDCAWECWKKNTPHHEGIRHLVWRENYLEGPLPSGVSREEFEKIRSGFLHSCVPEYSAEGIYRFLLKLHTTLEEFDSPEGEIILYFDCCMYDMIMLARILFLLKDFSGRIRLFCEDVMLGNAPQVFALPYSSIRLLAPETVSLYAHAWECVLQGASAVAQFNKENRAGDELFLKQAMIRYGEDHPVEGGLGRTEKQLLEIVRSGVNTFPEIFRAFDRYEIYMFMGDTHCFRLLQALTAKGFLRMEKSSPSDPYGSFYPAEKGAEPL